MVIAKLRHLRISPRKVRLVANLINGLDVKEAEKELKFSTKRSSRHILKLLKSAVANAKNNANWPEEGLYVSKVVVEMGPTLKRWMPRAMGRATPIMKRTSHIILELSLREGVQPLEKPLYDKKVAADKKEEKKKKILSDKEAPDLAEEIHQLEEKESPGPKKPAPKRPYPTTPKAKKRFFSRQTLGNAKKLFRRKSM